MSLKYTGNQTERLYSPELNNLANVSKNAVLEGLTPTQNLGTDMNIKVAVGEYFFGLNNYEKETETTVAVTSNSTSLSRIDIILINSAGTVSIVAGTPNTLPKPANYDPDLYIALGLITVGSGVTAITDSNIKDIRVLNVGGSGGSGAVSTVSVFRQTFTAQTSVTTIHGLDDNFPTVQVYDDNNEQITPDKIEIIDDDTVTTTFNVATTGTIVVMGGKAGVSIGVNKYYEGFSSQTALTVNHGLNDFFPTVQIYNSLGQLIIGDVSIGDANNVLLNFENAQTGYVVVHGGITGEGAVLLSEQLETTITDDDTKVPSSGAVVDYVSANANSAKIIELYTGSAIDVSISSSTTPVEQSYEMTSVSASTISTYGSNFVKVEICGLNELKHYGADDKIELKAQIKELGGSYIDIQPYQVSYNNQGASTSTVLVNNTMILLYELTTGMKSNGFQTKIFAKASAQSTSSANSFTNLNTIQTIIP